MSEILVCDACGERMRAESFCFDIEYMTRRAGGDIVDQEGNIHEWDHQFTYGDLCSDCSESVIEVLNGLLK